VGFRRHRLSAAGRPGRLVRRRRGDDGAAGGFVLAVALWLLDGLLADLLRGPLRWLAKPFRALASALGVLIVLPFVPASSWGRSCSNCSAGGRARRNPAALPRPRRCRPPAGARRT
jgi:hypothetical protein